jgi:hypothetical protein
LRELCDKTIIIIIIVIIIIISMQTEINGWDMRSNKRQVG